MYFDIHMCMIMYMYMIYVFFSFILIYVVELYNIFLCLFFLSLRWILIDHTHTS